MSGYQVSIDELRTASGQVGNAGDAATTQFSQLFANVNSLHQNWNGTAAQSFQDSYARWHASATQMIEALHSMATSLSTSADNYEQTELTNTSNLTAR